LKRLVREERGQSLIVVLLFMGVIFAIAALAIDVSSWDVKKHQAQVAADAVALAVANCLANGGTTGDTCTSASDTTDADAVAVAYAQKNGLTGITTANVASYVDINLTTGTVAVTAPNSTQTFFASASKVNPPAVVNGNATATFSSISPCTGAAETADSCGAMFAADPNCATVKNGQTYDALNGASYGSTATSGSDATPQDPYDPLGGGKGYNGGTVPSAAANPGNTTEGSTVGAQGGYAGGGYWGAEQWGVSPNNTALPSGSDTFLPSDSHAFAPGIVWFNPDNTDDEAGLQGEVMSDGEVDIAYVEANSSPDFIDFGSGDGCDLWISGFPYTESTAYGANPGYPFTVNSHNTYPPVNQVPSTQSYPQDWGGDSTYVLPGASSFGTLTSATPSGICQTTDSQPTSVSITLSAALSTRNAITSLPVDALTSAIPSGSSVLMTYVYRGTTEKQTWTTTANANANAVALSVTSQTPNYAYPTTTTVTATFTLTGTFYDGAWYDTDGATWTQTVPTTGDWVEMSVPCADQTDYNNAVSNTSEITFATGGTDPTGTTGVAIPTGVYSTSGNICVSNSDSASSCYQDSNNWSGAVMGDSDITLEATGATSTISIDGNVTTDATGSGDGTFADLCPAVGCPSKTAPTPGLLAYQADGWDSTGQTCSNTGTLAAGQPGEPELTMSAIGGEIQGTVFVPCGQTDVSYSSGGLGFLEGYDVDLYDFTGLTGSGPFGSEGTSGTGSDQLTQ
jgi:hypothetical protein